MQKECESRDSHSFCVLNLPLYTLVLIIKFVVRTASGISPEEAYHLVLIEVDTAAVAVGIFIIFVVFTALTACWVLHPIFRKIHNAPLHFVLFYSTTRRVKMQ